MKKLFKIADGLTMLFLPFILFAQDDSSGNKVKKWFPKYDFEINSFQKPALEFGPFARWWWPGNAVSPDELKREIDLFADNQFGGVEIQPMNLFVPGSKELRAKVITWDTEDYYQNVIVVMNEARKRGLIVDMTDGSGWPPGGPHLSIEDGFLNLQFNQVDIEGGKNISVLIPKIENSTGVPSRLETVLAIKKSVAKSIYPGTIALDSSSTMVVTNYVKNDSLFWSVPAGNWTIIAFWSKPGGENGMTASPKQGPVVNHFDSTKVIKNYDHLFGERTHLQPYFGNPMRSIFNDSYEFHVDRFYSYDFVTYFKQKRGYDITPWLPADMQRGYNFASYMRPDSQPDFTFSSEDWRLKYDYDLTLSELLGEHFFNTSKHWMEPKGLLHRTQAYGLNMDMIAQAGLASIPETESMLGPEANLKIMTSGGHLYNRPIESAESVVFKDRAYTTTPQKIKLAVDKLFAAGVNQVIYHGVPYRYTPDELGPEGWYPFSTTIVSGVNFSSNLGEGNIFWKNQEEVNEYISRTQYALRSGKPNTDVLIYFPFMDVDGMPDNPEEIMTKGYLDEVEGPLPVYKTGMNKEIRNADKEKWAEIVYPLINKLEANGITWEWVNDLSIQAAFLTNNKQINIRGNIYQALILANDSIIQLKTAEKISLLASEGMNFIAAGELPNRQPSYLNWMENDKKTAEFIQLALKAKTSKYLTNDEDISVWIASLQRPVSFKSQYHFTRQVERNMSDGTRIQFIWNKSAQWQTLTLTLDKKFLSSFWMNADGGIIIKNNGPVVSYQLPPYGSVILYASTKNIHPEKLSGVIPVVTDKTTEVLSLNNWTIQSDSATINSSRLFDWKLNDQLKYSTTDGVYKTTFSWKKDHSPAHFYLDMGSVYFTADVYLNDRFAGRRIFAPYILDISSYLISGENKIEIHITPGQLNGFIGKAKQGDSHYKQFRNKEDQIMSAGLIGPVTIRTKSN